MQRKATIIAICHFYLAQRAVSFEIKMKSCWKKNQHFSLTNKFNEKLKLKFTKIQRINSESRFKFKIPYLNWRLQIYESIQQTLNKQTYQFKSQKNIHFVAMAADGSGQNQNGVVQPLLTGKKIFHYHLFQISQKRLELCVTLSFVASSRIRFHYFITTCHLFMAITVLRM